jgi:hypothetical protein
MVKAQELFLMKIQETAGTAETGLDGDDLIEVMPDSSLEADTSFTEINLVGGGYTQDKGTPGMRRANVSLSFPLRDFGDGIKPDYVRGLQAARFDLTENNGYYILTPSDTATTDCTVWHYTGDLTASGAVLEKASNVKFDWTISFDFSGDGIAKLDLSGVGKHGGDVSDATQPTVNKNRTSVPSLTGVTMQINGSSDYECTSLTINGNQTVEPRVNPADSSGVGGTEVTERKIKFTATVYCDTKATIDPMNSFLNSTTGALKIHWGTSDEIKIDANYAQFTKAPTRSDNNGITTYELEGLLERNDFVMRIAGGESSSSSSSSSS